jgi:hypothetical protein
VSSPPSQREVFVELVVTVVIPALVLTLLSGPERLGPSWGLVLALLAPIGWGVAGIVRRGRVSGLAVLALFSVLLTGGVGLFELEPGWIAVKEATLPCVIGVGTMLSAKTRWAVMPTVLEVVLDEERVDAALGSDDKRLQWQRALQRGTVWVGALFFVSAFGNYALARWLVVSPAGTTAFNEELGRLTALSFPVLMLPMMAGMAWVLKGVLDRLEALTGEEVDALLRK